MTRQTVLPPHPVLTTVIQPALDAYAAAIATHQHDYSTWGTGTPIACLCGYVGRGRSPRRSVGLHVAAAERRASKAYDAESERLWNVAQDAHREAVKQAGGFQW